MDGYFCIDSGRKGAIKIYSDTWRSADGSVGSPRVRVGHCQDPDNKKPLLRSRGRGFFIDCQGRSVSIQGEAYAWATVLSF
jgi:hypothetical protein